MVQRDSQEKTLGSFTGGLNNVAREDQLSDSQLRKALNVDILPSGKIRRRRGFSSIYEGAGMHSLYATPNFLLLVEQSRLIQMFSDFIPRELYQGPFKEPLRYVEINGEVYLTDGRIGVIVSDSGEIRSFGVELPSGQPVMTPTSSGGLYAGSYQVAVTFLDKYGRESGATSPAIIRIPENGGVNLSNIPQPQDNAVRSIRIYMSDVEGDLLYLRTQVPVGQHSYLLGNIPAKKQLDSLFKAPMPPGEAVAFYNGRLYVAASNTLVFSDALDYGRYHVNDNYYLFASEILFVLPVSKGLFIGTRQGVEFFEGESPASFSRSVVTPISSIEGTGTCVSGVFFASELADTEVATWWGSDGVFYVGLPDGKLLNVKRTELALPDYESGAVAEVHREGVRQLVSVLKNPKANATIAFGDTLEVEIHRNGLQL